VSIRSSLAALMRRCQVREPDLYDELWQTYEAIASQFGAGSD
jgi:hypothetical protein